MVAKLFWQDPYRTSLDTRTAAVEGDVVRLEETIFYAFSGGQESDAGTIGGRKVLEARKHEGDILYTLEPGHGLQPGDALLIAGKGHEIGQIVGDKTLPFSDHEAVADALAARVA